MGLRAFNEKDGSSQWVDLGRKAKEKLGWEPKTTLEQLCQMMVEADLRRNKAGFSF